MTIVVGKDTGHKRQMYYNTFGFKVFIGENIPYDKGFRERLVDIPITKELRDKIKTLKMKQTYTQFLDSLVRTQ